ncbi:MAG: hypothetical protein H7320_15055 [Ferruginibacter sp.]|nr:hypothetical protein [Ferruginibacter sp.]
MPDPIKLSLNDSGDLVQSDGGITEIGNVLGRKVTWIIDDNEITSFQLIGKYRGNPFTELPTSQHGPKQELKAKFFVKSQDWDYAITWTDTRSTTKHMIDPKITINPVIGSTSLLLISVALAVTSCILAVKVSNLRKKITSLKNTSL